MTYPGLFEDRLLDSSSLPQLLLHAFFKLLPDPWHTHKDSWPHLLKKKRKILS